MSIVKYFICLLLFISINVSFAQRKESYSFHYLKKENLKKDKVKSYVWLQKDIHMDVEKVADQLHVKVGARTYLCKPMQEKNNLKGTTGVISIDGEERRCQIVVYKKETHSTPQVKITIYNNGKDEVIKYWFSAPKHFEQ